MKFTVATPERIPMILSISGVSGSGKSFSGMRLSAGLAGPTGRVGVVDTENRRAKLYVRDPLITSELPGGEYWYSELKAPFSPQRYIELIDAAESEGVTVLMIDSFSHEWEGEGGCAWIAENNKLGGQSNWAKAKIEHRKVVNRLLASNMDIVVCLRAREKSRPIPNSKQWEYLGLQPITEFNFVYEMMISLMVEEGEHLAKPLKVPRPLEHLFPVAGTLISKATGDGIREWASGGGERVKETDADLFERAEAFAKMGSQAYKDFFNTLASGDKHRLSKSVSHAMNKDIATKADKEKAEGSGETEPIGSGLFGG